LISTSFSPGIKRERKRIEEEEPEEESEESEEA
jgi:hypothetical protein